MPDDLSSSPAADAGPPPPPRRPPGRVWIDAMRRAAELRGGPNLPALVEAHAERDPDRPALLSAEGVLSYGALAERIRAISSGAAALGLGPERRAALFASGSVDYVAAWLGLTRAGAVAALIPPELRGPGLAHALRVSGAHLVLADPARLGPAAEATGKGLSTEPLAVLSAPGGARGAAAAAPAARGEALNVFTSGTTGFPKAARISHDRILAWSGWFSGLTGAGPEDRLYDALPLHHSVGGVAAVGCMLASGGGVVVRERFSAAAFWREAAAFDCTLIQYIGELCRYLLAAPSGPWDRAHRIRLACGAGLSADVWRPFQERFAIRDILEFYASTEGNFSLYNVEQRVGRIGRAPPAFAQRTEIVLVRHDSETEAPERGADGLCVPVADGEAGEALARIGGARGAAFEGYTDPEETARKVVRDVLEPGDAFFRSGDLLTRDADGFYGFVDRIGDTFRWKGENVAASEVRAALLEAPGVLDAAVYGVRVPGRDGRAGMAAIVAGEAFSPEALDAALGARLPAHARPVFLRLGAEIAATETFKPQKGRLKALGLEPGGPGERVLIRIAAGWRDLDADLRAELDAGRLRL